MYIVLIGEKMKKTKKIILISVIVVMLISLAACADKKSGTGKLKDGIYFAAEDNFNPKSGWKYCVTAEVKDGKFVSADWNGAHITGGTDKKTRSESGEYGMAAKGGASSEWHEQAAKTEAYFLENQDPLKITYKDDNGHTDDIAGVSIHVVEFYDLLNKALAKGPAGYGLYKDGSFHAEEPIFNHKSGWKYTADATVVSGYIMAANWNGVHKDGGDDKKTLSEAGGYGMVEKGGSSSEWHEQAYKTEAYIIANQNISKIKYKDVAGHTDDIAGVSIHVIEFYQLLGKALEKR